MRAEIHIAIEVPAEERERFLALGIPGVPEDAAADGRFHIRLRAHSADVRDAIGILSSLPYAMEVREERHFTRREIEGAAALHVAATRMLTFQPGTEEDGERCPVCGRADTPATPVVRSDLPEGTAFAALSDGSFIVSESFVLEMVKASVSGALLEPLAADPDAPIRGDGFYRLVHTHEMPRLMSPPTRFARIDGPCPACGRSGHVLASMMYYDAPLSDLDDINLSRETFDAGSGARRRELVVSQRFATLLMDLAPDDVMVEPVLFV